MATMDKTYTRDEAIGLIRRAFAMRAQAYAHIHDVLAEELGADRALELTMRATERMGRQMGASLAALGPDDLAGLRDAFLGGIIEGEALFGPEVKRCDSDELIIQFHRCPLKEGWIAMGRNPAEVATLCRMAGAIDKGLFEAAGFTFAGETYRPGDAGCCRLRVLKGVAAGSSATTKP